MPDEKHNDIQRFLDKLISFLMGSPWPDVLSNVLRILPKLVRSQCYGEMYEALEYESTLELKDRAGKRAIFKKREKVRYLQDNVIAYQDQAWGDGEILANYQCTPGTPVDQYRFGHKTHILISRREVKNKGDVDVFNIEWGIRQGFLRRTEHWETHIIHRMKHLKVSVVFPKSRPPQRAWLTESNRQRNHNLVERKLPGGRWQVAWETHRPRLYENYILQWEW
jgi:hypothetical protein